MLNLLSCFQWFIGIPWGILEWLVIWKLFKSSPNIPKIVDFLFFCFLMVQYINIKKTQPVSEMKSIISVKVMTALKYMYMYD